MPPRKPRQPPTARPAVPGASRPAWQRPLPLALGLAALTLAVYWQVQTFGFVNWDDPSYITENPHVRDGLTLPSAWWALTTGYTPYWHPLTWLSHLIDISLFGMDAGAHHLTSLLLHVANTLLVFALFRSMTAETGRSAFVAAIFAVHPLHVESVAWIAERKDVLSTLCWALAVAAYLRYVNRPSAAWYAAVMGLFGLALMAKPMVVTLPVVLLLLDIWPLRRVAFEPGGRTPWRRIIAEKVPLLLLGFLTSVATIVVQHRVGAMAGLDALSWQFRLENAIVSYGEYVWKTIWPVRLAAFYPFRDYSAWLVAGMAALLVAVTGAVVAQRRRRPYLLVGWFWYGVTLAPVIGLLQAGEQRLADRFLYVPMIGLLVVVAWGVPDLLARRPAAASPAAPSRRSGLLTATALAIVLACAVTARAQVSHWESSVTLWEHGTRATPDSYIAFENLGQALRERGRYDESIASYRQALALAPPRSPSYQAVIHNSLGLVLTRAGNDAAALPEFEAAARLDPGFAEARSNLGNALAAAGRFDRAVPEYQAAIALDPEAAEARVGLGSALLSAGRAREAADAYAEALRLDPSLAQAHNGRGAALAQQGLEQDAMAEYEEALRLKPDLATAHLNVAVVLIRQGRLDDARRRLQQAVRIDPGYAPARELLSRLGG
jgi:protein O-mannosyl-transferase